MSDEFRVKRAEKTMKKKITVLTLCAMLLALSSSTHAQEPKKVPRIGFLFIGSKDQPYLDSFRQGLRDLGYVEGKNIVIDYRYAEGKNNALPTLAAGLVALNLDVILTTTVSARTARRSPRNQYNSYCIRWCRRPVRLGLAESLAQPGGNLTGLSSSAGPGMEGKRLALFKEAIPKISVVTLLWNPEAQIGGFVLQEAKTGANSLGLQLRSYEIMSAGDIDRAFDDLKTRNRNALLITGGPIMTRNSRRIAELAVKLRLPSMYQTRQFVEDGGLMAYGTNFADLYQRAAIYVDKLLKGRKPADLPIELPMKFEVI